MKGGEEKPYNYVKSRRNEISLAIERLRASAITTTPSSVQKQYAEDIETVCDAALPVPEARPLAQRECEKTKT